jgi:hypothetical protein
VIRIVDVNAGYGAEKSMGHQPALYFVPDLAKTRIEFLSVFRVFHGSLAT